MLGNNHLKGAALPLLAGPSSQPHINTTQEEHGVSEQASGNDGHLMKLLQLL